jgi:hypothetical protein
MVDVIETEQVDESQELAEAQVETEAAPKINRNVDKPCLCSFYEVGNYEEGSDEVFTTGCEQKTKRTFAQGHDARLVSFLVDGYFDGYDIRLVDGGVATTFATPGEAARVASESLGDKATKATENRRVKRDSADLKKAEREAAKAEKAKEKAEKAEAKAKEKAEKAEAAKSTPQVEVVAGSHEGDVPELPEGVVKIKVGRWEYDATIDPETGAASYIDGKGDEQTTERDGYRLLQNA